MYWIISIELIERKKIGKSVRSYEYDFVTFHIFHFQLLPICYYYIEHIQALFSFATSTYSFTVYVKLNVYIKKVKTAFFYAY